MAKAVNAKTWALPSVDGVRSSWLAGTDPGGEDWQLAEGHFEPSYGTMEIIAPRAGLSTASRYYKAYPGLLYRVPVAVLYGAWPFKYELTTAPEGMTIGSVLGDDDYGIINWANPTTSGSPHSVTVKVTDQEGTEVTVSWTITVTTSGFIFVDAVNGHASAANGGSPAGDGTIENPFLTMNDWYAGSTGGTGSGTKNNTTYREYFVYYREGTYETGTMFSESGDWGQRVPCVGNNKPKVHMAYPGESVTMDVAAAELIFYGDNGMGVWFQGMKPINIGEESQYHWFSWDAGMDNIVIFENTLPDAVGVGSRNSAFWMCRANGVQRSTYQAYVNNIFEGANSQHMLFELYGSNKVVFEGGSVSNNRGGGSGAYFKDEATSFIVRNVHGLTGNTAPLVRVDNYSSNGAVLGVICHCNYKTSGNGILLGTTNGVDIGSIVEYRNTWQVSRMQVSGPDDGSIASTRSVIIHSGSYTDGWDVSGGFEGSFNKTQLLTGTSGIVDSSTGLLTGDDRTTYLGIRGHEIA